MLPPYSSPEVEPSDDRLPYANRVAPSVAAVALLSLLPVALIVAASYPVHAVAVASTALVAVAVRSPDR
jgi:hypothetical protein